MANSLADRLIRITDIDDPRVSVFRDVRERDLRGREGLFIAEGTVVLNVLAGCHGQPGNAKADRVLVLENRLPGVAETLARFPDDVPIMVAERGVIDGIAGFPLHRGVLAAAARPRPPAASVMLRDLPDPALVLVACGIANHDNMGALFRNAAALGADALILDRTCCDPLYRKAIRVSVGASLTMPYAAGDTVEAIVDALAGAGFDTIGLSPRGDREIFGITPRRRAALLVGTEGEGLPANVLAKVSTARIAQSNLMDSLNVATAAGIALHAVASAMGRIS